VKHISYIQAVQILYQRQSTAPLPEAVQLFA
jgi:hypothetical protein